MRHLHFFLLVLVVLSACTGRQEHAQMQQRLGTLNAVNRADTVLTATHRDEAQLLCRYFDRHGTPNEQMLAHYLLGRCYADMHEAPMALHCYQDAIDRADTTAQDCDFAQLSRVYGQSASIFYEQGLYRNMLEYCDLSCKFGWCGKDTLAALISYAQNAFAYSQLKQNDSALIIQDSVIKQLKLYKHYQYADAFSGFMANLLLKRGDFDKAEQYFHAHENGSGYFNEKGEIEKGREIYYSFKGEYFLKKHQLDSAEYYFRKELCDGKDFNNQNCGAYGLALLYQQRHKQDSAAKYFAYAYAMNDSFFVQMTTHEVEQAKAMYDYSRNQSMAEQERYRASQQTVRLLVVGGITLLLSVALGIIVFLYVALHKKREREIASYHKLQKQLETMQSEMSELHEHKIAFSGLIDNKESGLNSLDPSDATFEDALAEIKQLREREIKLNKLIGEKETAIINLEVQLTRYEQQHAELSKKEKTEQKVLIDLPFYQELMNKSNKGTVLTDSDWNQIDLLLKDVLPVFHEFMLSNKNYLSEREYKVCLLTRLHFPGKTIASFIGAAPSYITKYRKDLHEKLFQGCGNSKAFVTILNTIG